MLDWNTGTNRRQYYHIEAELRQFYKESFNSNVNKYRSLALCTTRYLTSTNHQKFGFSGVTFIKQSFVDYPVTMMLLYRSPNSSEIVFLYDQPVAYTEHGSYNIGRF